MWIRPLVAEEVDGVMRLYAPNPYWTRYIQDNHLELISILLSNCLKVEYVKVEIWLIRVQVLFCLLMKPATTTAALGNTSTTAIVPLKKKETDLVQPSQNVAEKTKEKDNSTHYLHFLLLKVVLKQMAAETCRKVLTQLGASQHNPLFYMVQQVWVKHI